MKIGTLNSKFIVLGGEEKIKFWGLIHMPINLRKVNIPKTKNELISQNN